MEINELKEKGYYIGIIDGVDCEDTNSFLVQIGLAFKFPDYYGQNIDAFDECINDLDWLDEHNYVLVIKNYDLFMSKDTVDNKNYLIELFKSISKEWMNVPNYEGEEIYRDKADFRVIYEQY